MTKISIFTPVHRTDRLFEQCVKSVIANNGNWEMILLDNTNIRNVKEWLEQRNLNRTNIKVYEQIGYEQRLGLLKGIASNLCTGDLLLELDCDDMLMPNAIEYISKIHEEINYDFYYGNCFSILYNGKTFESLTTLPHLKILELGKVLYGENGLLSVPGLDINGGRIKVHGILNWDIAGILKGNTAFHPRIWKREFFHLIGGFNQSLEFCEDHDLIFRTILNTDKICRIERPCYIYVVHDTNITKLIFAEKQKQFFNELVESYEEDLRQRCMDSCTVKIVKKTINE